MDNATEIAISIVGGAAIIGFIIYCKYIAKQANKGKKYLIEHFEEVKTLSKNYANIAINYIEKLKAIDALLFTVSYNTTKNLIVSHYWQQKPNLLLSNIYQYDGFVKPKDKVNLILPNEEFAKKLTEDVIAELKNKILADNSWADKYTLPSLIYFIIRNNIIEIFAWQSNNIIPKGRANYNREHQKEQDEEIKRHGEESKCLIKEQKTEQVQEWDKEWENYKQEQKEKERLERERIQKEKEARERESIKYLETNKDNLIGKYSRIVENFIKKLKDSNCTPFLKMFTDSDIPLSSILLYPYREVFQYRSESLQYSELTAKLLKDKVLRDGLQFTQSANDVLNNRIQELTTFFIKGLKKRIKENGEWDDNSTFPILIYFIMRNNIIKYYHDKYIKELGYESLEEFCKNISNALSTTPNIFAYTYYHIYNTNINLPFVDTYRSICSDIKSTIARQKEKKLEDDLFGDSAIKTIPIYDNKIITLTPIDRIDRMNGEQFEIFMEDFFIKQGFKVTRTPLSGDYGIDLIIENDFSKIGVQAKCYSNKVTQSAVREVVAGLRHYNLSSGMVVTNNYFQPAAIRLAADNNITLWDRDKLVNKLGE
ncbi:MAG: restriction endonuclease [Clostridia bacterium]|nr:restriction endonuclease [Clostridia bacterium]